MVAEKESAFGPLTPPVKYLVVSTERIYKKGHERIEKVKCSSKTYQ